MYIGALSRFAHSIAGGTLILGTYKFDKDNQPSALNATAVA
jgi:hypothetical protein